jgi:hypothetical protein
MGRQFLLVNDVTGVPGASVSGSLRARIPSDGRLMAVKTVVTKGGALATLDEMRVALTECRFVLGTEDVRKIRACDYFAIQALNGFAPEAGLFEYFYAEPWRATVADEEVLGLETRRYGPYVDFEVDVTNTATPLAFEFNTEIDDRPKVAPDGQPIFGMVDWTSQGTGVLGSGVKNILLDKFDGALQRLYITSPSATTTISRVRILRGRSGNNVIYDRTQTATNPGLKSQLKGMGMTIPAAYTSPGAVSQNMWPVVFDNNQQLRNRIAEPGEDIRVEITHSAAAEFNIIRESLIAR